MNVYIPARGALVLDTESLGAVQVIEFEWAVRVADGRIVGGRREVAAGTTLGSAVRAVVPMVEGQLVYASARALNGGVQPGLVWARMSVTDQPTLAGSYVNPIIQGWASVLAGPSYPTHPVWPADGLGSPPVTFEGDVPAAGAESLLVLTTLELTELQAVRVTLTTSAVVANRQVRLVCLIGAAPQWLVTTLLVQVASGTRPWTWLPNGADDILDGVDFNVGRLGPGVAAGHTLRTSTLLRDAGDQFSALRVTGRWQPVTF